MSCYRTQENNLGAMANAAMISFLRENDIADVSVFRAYLNFCLLGNPVIKLPNWPGMNPDNPPMMEISNAEEFDALDIPVFYLDEQGTCSVTAQVVSGTTPSRITCINADTGEFVGDWFVDAIPGTLDVRIENEGMYLMTAATTKGKQSRNYFRVTGQHPGVPVDIITVPVVPPEFPFQIIVDHPDSYDDGLYTIEYSQDYSRQFGDSVENSLGYWETDGFEPTGEEFISEPLSYASVQGKKYRRVDALGPFDREVRSASQLLGDGRRSRCR